MYVYENVLVACGSGFGFACGFAVTQLGRASRPSVLECLLFSTMHSIRISVGCEFRTERIVENKACGGSVE